MAKSYSVPGPVRRLAVLAVTFTFLYTGAKGCSTTVSTLRSNGSINQSTPIDITVTIKTRTTIPPNKPAPVSFFENLAFNSILIRLYFGMILAIEYTIPVQSTALGKKNTAPMLSPVR